MDASLGQTQSAILPRTERLTMSEGIHFLAGNGFVCSSCGDVKPISDLIIVEDKRMLCPRCYIEEFESAHEGENHD